MDIKTPVPVVLPQSCPGCGDVPSASYFGAVLDMLVYDEKFEMGKGGYVRLIGWVSCADHLIGTVVDSFDNEGNSKWEGTPRPWSTEHVYIKDLPGRKLVSIDTCELPVEILTRAQYHEKYDAWAKTL